MVEVNVAVTLGLACERVLFGGAGVAKLLGKAHKSVPEECPSRVSCKSDPQEFPTRLSQECPTRGSQKSVRQECPRRVSHKSVPYDCPTRVSRKSVPQKIVKGQLKEPPEPSQFFRKNHRIYQEQYVF